MSNLILEPTDENLLTTYLQNKIDRNGELYYFVKMLNGISGGNAIAINGEWGCGKTFFVKQAKMIIDSFNINNDYGSLSEDNLQAIKAEFAKYASQNGQKIITPMATVYYDAWEHDDDDDPLMSLVYSIVTRFNTNLQTDTLDFVKKLALNTVPLIDSLIQDMTGISIKEELTLLKNAIESQEDFLKKARERAKVKQQIRELLSDILYADETKLVIFIDELDRCNPRYAIKLLERVKHYFNHENVTFVFSCNMSELQHSIKTLYGNEFKADKYLRRFFDFDIELSEINITQYVVNTRLLENGLIDDNIDTVARMYNFSLRDSCQYYEFMNIAANKVEALYNSAWYGTGKSLSMLVNWIMPVFIGLRFHNIDAYNAFKHGELFIELEKFIDNKNLNATFYFNELLKENELYAESNEQRKSGHKYIMLKDRLEELYKTVFSRELYDEHRELGNIVINKDIRNTFFSICSGMSNIAEVRNK